MTIGSKVKELRARKGQSLQQVADAVGASKAHVWEIEAEKSANPSLDLLTKLAKHFGVPISHLLEETSDAEALIFGREFKGATEEDKKILWQLAERMIGKKERKK